ncbi:adenosine deaminase [Photobacterium sp. 1_MG-2023]|nr:adenosine deaminase [Photobacterium sp. 1_MG-2023]MDO6704956.1 adenosine deaminase [Photobacterium sp. 1_MG-2023]
MKKSKKSTPKKDKETPPLNEHKKANSTRRKIEDILEKRNFEKLFDF